MPDPADSQLSDGQRPDLQARRARVLLAEDDHDVLIGIAQLLERGGYEVRSVCDGGELLDAVTGCVLGGGDLPADALITDVRMPGINGLSVVEGLRAQGFVEPIVVMSAFGDAELRARVAQLPNVVFLAKPFDPHELEETLATLLLARSH